MLEIFEVAARAAQGPSKPIIIKIQDPPSELNTLGGVLLRALGLTGTLVLIAILLAMAFGGLMFWIRSRGE